MDIVTILRELRRRRRSVGVAFLVAVLAAVLVMYQLPSLKSRSHDVGVASTQVLLDTPSSQVVAVEPKGSDTLGMRANLLASLMIDGDVESAIAHRAGLKPDQIGGMTDAATDVSPGSSLSAGPPPAASRPYTLTTHILSDATNMPLPIIEVDVQAPTSDGAVRLARAAVLGLKDYLASTAAEESIPDVQRLQVDGLGVPQGSTVTEGPTTAFAVLVMILVFVLGCASILAGAALRRRWHAAAEREALEAQGLLPPDEPFRPPRPAEPVPAPQASLESDEADGADVEPAAPELLDVSATVQTPGERRPSESLLSILRRSGQIEPGNGESSPDDLDLQAASEPRTDGAQGGATLPRVATRRAFYFSVGSE
jgi:hypothetical protein